jgi:hypothetical protein
VWARTTSEGHQTPSLQQQGRRERSLAKGLSYINIYILCVARTLKEKETCTHYKERKEIEREEGSSSGLLAKLFLEAIEATPQILQPRLNLSGS